MADTPVERALRELVAAKESQDAVRRLSRRYYMPDKYTAADERLGSAWAAARAALADTPAPSVSGGSLVALADTTKAGCASSDGIDAKREAFLADKSPGSPYHLTLLMARYHLNMVVGDDREKLLSYARDVWDAAIDQAEGVRR